jgi:phosphoadenosine phosphosulfate reductase
VTTLLDPPSRRAADPRPGGAAASSPAPVGLPPRWSYSPEYLRSLVDVAARELEGASAEEILGWALDKFHPRLAVAASMGETVVAHMASRIREGVPVVFLDTGYHFAETLGTADAVETVYPVELVRIRPALTVAEQDAQYGAKLYERDPDLCCKMRKVEPLERGLAPYMAWASGLRRDEAESRADARAVEWDAKRQRVKVNPLVDWTQDDVDAYIAEHGVLVNPLLSDGYGSIGCAPCTRRLLPGEDARAGRWAGMNKVECGIH